MKKKTNGFVSVLLALCLLLAPMTVFAESNAQLNYVTDDAGILTDSQWEDLEQRAQQVSEEYQCGVYMITVDDYTDYSTESVYTADYTIYHNYEMGMGEDRDGIMILLSMEDRDYAMFVYGPKASEVFDAYILYPDKRSAHPTAGFPAAGRSPGQAGYAAAVRR